MKSKTINNVARSINTRRNTLESIITDFRAEFGAVNKDLARKALKDAVTKEERYTAERVLAKIKGMQVPDDERQLIISMREDGFGFEQLNLSWIVENIHEKYVSPDGLLMEERKDKATGEKKYTVIERWTVLKLARYFRLADSYRRAKASM